MRGLRTVRWHAPADLQQVKDALICSDKGNTENKPRTQVQHLMQIDLKEGWGVGYLSSFQQYCVRQMLNSVAGLREWFAQSDERNAHPRIPVMVNLSSTAVSSKKNQKPNDFSINPTSLDQMNATSRSSALIDEYFDDEEDFQIAEPEQEAYQIGLENDVRKTALEEEPAHEIDFSSFSGNLRRDDRDNARDCWKISDGNNFKVRSKHYCYEKTKKVPAGKHMLDLVAVDWFIDSKRMDHVARRHGCAAQVASEKGFFSIVLNLQVNMRCSDRDEQIQVPRELVGIEGDNQVHVND
ncbi:hypothetical protein JHK86_044869 [Glycine max]|nr:hypothetical protein JHK86_044869 [Glycine max]